MADRIHYTIGPTSESSVSMQVLQSGLMARRRHILFFEHYGGQVAYDKENPENSHVELWFDGSRLVCRDQGRKRVKALTLLAVFQRDILEADRHSKIAFRSDRIQRQGPNRFRIEGTVTIRGNSRPATVEVAVVRLGSDRLEIDASGTVRLSAYGVKPKRAFFGLATLKDEVVLRFLLWPERVAAPKMV